MYRRLLSGLSLAVASLAVPSSSEARPGSGWSRVGALELRSAPATAPARGLVAAYAMDEGAGSIVRDASGYGNHGRLKHATWARGRFGTALRFRGKRSLVRVADAASLDLAAGMTIEGWVKPGALGNAWRTVVLKGRPRRTVYSLYANGKGRKVRRRARRDRARGPSAHVHVRGRRSVVARSRLRRSRWTHLATTYDGSVLRLYVNGALVARRPRTGSITTSRGALRIGGDRVSRRHFRGLIDEVRIYDRRLLAAEIRSDMSGPIGGPDIQAPTAPGGLTATESTGSIDLQWAASSDDVGVARYNVHRSTSPGFTPSASNRIGQPTATSYTDAGVNEGTFFYRVTAEDGAGNLSPPSPEASVTVSVRPDTTPPSVTRMTPEDGWAGVGVDTAVKAAFSEPVRESSITPDTFVLRDAEGSLVPASVSYDRDAQVATLNPDRMLRYGTGYRAAVEGGPDGVTDVSGNPLESDATWSFGTEASTPRFLVVGSAANPFADYLGEILRAEGLTAFRTIDVASLDAAVLGDVEMVVLGDVELTAAQVSALASWVAAGGDLVASRPDKQLAGLLGLADAGGTLTNGYVKANASTAAGAGISDATMQFHGTADRYELAGATAIATLHAGATSPPSNPAVTLRSVGAAGGEAAAFAYDLARSVVYTRQGNPAWAGQERDGEPGVRPNDMFYGAKPGDLQPDWLDTSRIAIPQADEQQRLLANLITLMVRDKLPLPRFWYLPRGEKAAVVLSGDDHSPSQSPGYTAANFRQLEALSPAKCVVADWECVRATAFVYPTATLTNAEAAGYVSRGFEVALHPNVGSCPVVPPSQSDMATAFDDQLREFASRYPSVPSPASNRTHCVAWPDWASAPKVEHARGMRMDANYYHYPESWLGSRPGFMNGGGFPMRFADADGTAIDVFQLHTNMNDEAGQPYPATVDALLDNAVGANGFYGAFGVNIHFDYAAPQRALDAIVRSAQDRGVPVVSYKQMLVWTDGRNASTIRSPAWASGTLSFSTIVGVGAAGLQTMLPTRGPTGTLAALECSGSPVSYDVLTVKGVEYAMFPAVDGTCRATYS